jgi:hypothetical protein
MAHGANQNFRRIFATCSAHDEGFSPFLALFGSIGLADSELIELAALRIEHQLPCVKRIQVSYLSIHLY